MLGRIHHLAQQLLEPLFRQQADILCEHGEEAAHEELCDLLGVVLAFQAAGDAGEALGDVAGDLGAAFGGIEGVRGAPDRAQAVSDGPVAQTFQRDGIAAPIRELGVVLPLAGEVSVDLDHVTDIDDEDEGRPAVLLRQRAGVVLRLPLGGAHHLVPPSCTASGRAGADLGGVLGDQLRLLRVDLLRFDPFGRLLGLHDEAIALVQVDPAPGRRAIVKLVVDAPFEDVVVGFDPLLRWIGFRQVKQGAKLLGERLEVRDLCAAGFLPPADEVINSGGVGSVVDGGRLCVCGTHGARIANGANVESHLCCLALSCPFGLRSSTVLLPVRTRHGRLHGYQAAPDDTYWPAASALMRSARCGARAEPRRRCRPWSRRPRLARSFGAGHVECVIQHGDDAGVGVVLVEADVVLVLSEFVGGAVQQPGNMVHGRADPAADGFVRAERIGSPIATAAQKRHPAS